MNKKTDWDVYYSKPYKTAKYSRKIVEKNLVKSIKKYVPDNKELKIVEIGGANSCFYENINKTFSPKKYCIIDNNQLGLDKFKKRLKNNKNTILYNDNILNLKNNYLESDLTFSVGLIEHFSKEDTKKAIIGHFNTLKKGGILILSFPTPTFLYKISRNISELFGFWIFHDERPLKIREVLQTAEDYGEILHYHIIWPIFFTQAMIIIKNK